MKVRHVITISEDESDQPEHRRGSFGRPVPGFETKVVDGELCIRGPHVMQRYYKRSREECFDADGWFHTGDLVRTDADGFVYFIGRRDAMIKTAGANVAPAEVERAIAKVAGGTVAHVLGLPDAERGQLVAAVVAHLFHLDDVQVVDRGRGRRERSYTIAGWSHEASLRSGPMRREIVQFRP